MAFRARIPTRDYDARMSDSPRGSVSLLLAGLKAGDTEALGPLWERYFHRLAGLARTRMGKAQVIADGEDVALDALHSLCRGAAAGRFPKLDDRTDLWRVLVCLTARKAGGRRRDEGRQKRGGGSLRRADDTTLEDLLSEEPSPEVVVMLADLTGRMLEGLGDETLRRVALMKMEGLSNDEIAERLDCVPRTVERKLAVIRNAWTSAD